MTVTPLLAPEITIIETVTRHPLNFYESPSWFTTELLRHVKLFGVIGEPCVGHGAIASLLNVWPHTEHIWTNDIDPHKQAHFHYDATLAESWEKFPECDWICTNPPYAEFAAPIIKNAYQKARIGVTAFLLTSFLEPCDDRADFLQQHPPSLVLILPRFCFRKDKRGTRWATDNITISCFVWDKRADRTVSAVNIDALADLVMEKYRRRQLIKVGYEIVQLGYETQTELPLVLSLAEAKVFTVTQNQSDERSKVFSAQDMGFELFQKLEMGSMAGDKVGWYDIENITGGIYPSSLVVVAAESHMGKTHFMISYAYEIMTKLEKPVLYVTPEMDKNQLNARMLARITGVDASLIQTNTQHYWEQIGQGIGQMVELPWKVYEHSSPTTAMIASAVRRAIAENGCSIGAVFIDYLQQIPLESGGNMAFEVGKITRQIRDIAKSHKIPVFLGCQINRGNQTTADKRPNRHLLRNSGEIFEVCDQLIMLYRDAVYTKDPSDAFGNSKRERTIELIVEKNRLYGKLGTATMLCDLSTSRFLNLAR